MLFYLYFNYNKLKTVKGNIFATYVEAYSYYLAVYTGSYNNDYYNHVFNLIFEKKFKAVNPELENILGDWEDLIKAYPKRGSKIKRKSNY